MLTNLLSGLTPEQLAYKDKKIPVSEATIDAIIGFVVVFFGIAILVGVLWLVGYLMKKSTGTASKQDKVEEKPVKPEVKAELLPLENTNDLDEETVAVIMAALTAYYQTNNPKCEFTVRRIKRI